MHSSSRPDVVGNGGSCKSPPNPDPGEASTGPRAATQHNTPAGGGVRTVTGWLLAPGVVFFRLANRFVGNFGLWVLIPFVVGLAFAPAVLGSSIAYAVIGLYVVGFFASDRSARSGSLRGSTGGTSDRSTVRAVADTDTDPDTGTDTGTGTGTGTDSDTVRRVAASDGLGTLRRRVAGGGFGSPGAVDRNSRGWIVGAA